eukprot:766641-Hanusia_phi.AAC.1
MRHYRPSPRLGKETVSPACFPVSVSHSANTSGGFDRQRADGFNAATNQPPSFGFGSFGGFGGSPSVQPPAMGAAPAAPVQATSPNSAFMFPGASAGVQAPPSFGFHPASDNVAPTVPATPQPLKSPFSSAQGLDLAFSSPRPADLLPPAPGDPSVSGGSGQTIVQLRANNLEEFLSSHLRPVKAILFTKKT